LDHISFNISSESFCIKRLYSNNNNHHNKRQHCKLQNKQQYPTTKQPHARYFGFGLPHTFSPININTIIIVIVSLFLVGNYYHLQQQQQQYLHFGVATAFSTIAFTTTPLGRRRRRRTSSIGNNNNTNEMSDTVAAAATTTDDADVAAGGGGDGKFHFAIDRGGTFTDVMCKLPNGKEVVFKLLSEDPQHYDDAPTEGIRRLLYDHDKQSGLDYTRGRPVPTSNIGSIRMGTTVATNALLERRGARMALITTKGFGDLLEIGNQARPDIFDLSCSTPSLLYERVVEVDERVLLEEHCDMDKVTSLTTKIGLTQEKVLIERVPDLKIVRKELERLKDAGITALAIAFMHGYTYGEHERQVGELARTMDCFEQISMSHDVMPMIKLVPRGHTTCAAAYLTPKITTYLANFQRGFDTDLIEVPLQFMKSDGGLAPVNAFGGHQAILSGPAGGVVGYAKTAFDPITKTPVIGFDMGGTSTDVSRFDGHLELVFETVTAGVAIQA
jgi:5-oxoprolinase (ATP-hydrolysing)